MQLSKYTIGPRPPKRDLETIVEQLYPFFSRRPMGKKGDFRAASGDNPNIDFGPEEGENFSLVRARVGFSRHPGGPGTPFCQDILRWLDEMVAALANESAEAGAADTGAAKANGSDKEKINPGEINAGELNTGELNTGDTELRKTDRWKISAYAAEAIKAIKAGSNNWLSPEDLDYLPHALDSYTNEGYLLKSHAMKETYSRTPKGIYNPILETRVREYTHSSAQHAKHNIKEAGKPISPISDELVNIISELYHIRSPDSGQPPAQARRQDKLDVVPQGRKIADDIYSLDLNIEEMAFQANYAIDQNPKSTLMRIKTPDGVETLEVESTSDIARAYRALDTKGLVGIFQKSSTGEIELAEIRGLEGAKLELRSGSGGTISINYTLPQMRPSDFDYLNQDLVINPKSQNHSYDFISPVVVDEKRAADSSLRALTVINEQGRQEEYSVRNNSAIAIMADAMQESGYTPEIKKMDVLSNDGTRIESGIYIRNAYKTGLSGQKQALIKDLGHGGLWVELSQGSSRSEFISPAGCSLNLEKATPLPGQVIEARLGVVGRYDNRNPA